MGKILKSASATALRQYKYNPSIKNMNIILTVKINAVNNSGKYTTWTKQLKADH